MAGKVKLKCAVLSLDINGFLIYVTTATQL